MIREVSNLENFLGTSPNDADDEIQKRIMRRRAVLASYYDEMHIDVFSVQETR